MFLDARRYSDSVLWNHSCPSLCLSVCPSLKIWSLFFSCIVHDDSWPWRLVTDGARFLKKSFGSPNLTKIGPKTRFFFSHFLKFGSLVFLSITFDDRLEQCLTTSRGKTFKKFCGPKSGPNRPESGLKLGFIFPWHCTRLQLGTMSNI